MRRPDGSMSKKDKRAVSALLGPMHGVHAEVDRLTQILNAAIPQVQSVQFPSPQPVRWGKPFKITGQITINNKIKPFKPGTIRVRYR